MRAQFTLALPTDPVFACHVRHVGDAGNLPALARWSEWLGLRARVALDLGLGIAATAILLSTAAQAQTTVPGKIPGQFAVSPSGAATYSIPIQVPPGIAGMQPKLSLEYNSQGGNGIMGMGWSLAGLSSITRCPQTRAQDGANAITSINYDWNDRYCLDGQRLILTDVNGANVSYASSLGSQYRTEIESFSQIVPVGQAGNGPASFIVKTKAGLTMEYGNPGVAAADANARIEAQGKSSVMVWALNKITDIKGNTMTVSYYEDMINPYFYPIRIDYAGNSVIFDYGNSARPDVVSGYRAGSLTTMALRLNTISVLTGAATTTVTKLQYTQSANSRRSTLSSVQLCDGTTPGLCLPSLQIQWSGSEAYIFNNSGYTSSMPDTYFVGSAGNVNMGTQLADINGDGLPDLIQLYFPLNGDYGNVPQKRVFLNTGIGFAYNAGYSASLVDTYFVGSAGNINMGTQLVDMNGDGLPDLVQLYYPTNGDYGNAPQKRVYLNTGTGFAYKPSLSASLPDAWFTVAAADSGAKIVDLDGDGMPDLIQLYFPVNTDYGNIPQRRVFLNIGSSDRVVGTINNQSFDLGIQYQSIAGNSSIYSKDNNAAYPKIDLQVPLHVVSSSSKTSGITTATANPLVFIIPSNITNYSYGGLKAEQGTGRGMLGFRWMQSKELSTGIETRTEYLQDWPYTGMPVKSETRLAGYGNAGLLKRSANTPACKIPQNSAACTTTAGNRYFPYIASSVEESWELNGGQALPTLTTTTDYSSPGTTLWGDPIRITVSTNDGASKVVVNEYEPANITGGNWILGRLKRATVTSSKP